jgi:hypothetical protein
MAAVPPIEVPIQVTFALGKPGDTLILGIPGSEHWGPQQVYDLEQMIRNRCPQLKDCIVTPANTIAAVEPEEMRMDNG